MTVRCPHELQVVLWDKAEVARVCVLENAYPVLNLMETTNNITLLSGKMTSFKCREVVTYMVDFEIVHLAEGLKEVLVKDDRLIKRFGQWQLVFWLSFND